MSDWGEIRAAAQAVVDNDIGLFADDGRALGVYEVATAMATDALLYDIDPGESLRRRQPEVPVMLPDVVLPKELVGRDDHVFVRRVDLAEFREGVISTALDVYRRGRCGGDHDRDAPTNHLGECPDCGQLIDPFKSLGGHGGLWRSPDYGRTKYNRFQRAHNDIRDDDIIAGRASATKADYDRWDEDDNYRR